MQSDQNSNPRTQTGEIVRQLASDTKKIYGKPCERPKKGPSVLNNYIYKYTYKRQTAQYLIPKRETNKTNKTKTEMQPWKSPGSYESQETLNRIGMI